MIKVWGRRNSVNVQKVMWVLGELNVPYQRVDAAGSFGITDDYRQLNPNAVVPTIQDGGLTLWESNACVRYLARTYGQGSLWPTAPKTLAIADQWMDWAATTWSPAFMGVFLNKIRVPADKADAQQLAQSTKNAATLALRLDAHLANTRYLAGEEFTMGDIPLGSACYRYFTMEIERPDLPHLSAWYQRLTERPAYSKHVMIPFGRNKTEWDAAEAGSAGVQ